MAQPLMAASYSRRTSVPTVPTLGLPAAGVTGPATMRPTPATNPGMTLRRTKCTTELNPGMYLEGRQATYYLHTLLGKGCYAEVFKGESMDRKTYAIKVIPQDLASTAHQHLAEAEKMLALHHPNIVAAIEAFPYKGEQCVYTCIVAEFCAGGTLLERIKAMDPTEFTLKRVARYLYQIASGLDFLHSNGIIHGDLKSDNILLTSKRQPKISDFGHSRRLTKGEDHDRPVGDLMFAPPEYGRERLVSAAFDLWGLGCILCEMATLRTTASRSPGLPFFANRPAFGQVMQDMSTAHDGAFLRIAQELCDLDPKQRMSAARTAEAAAALGGAVEPRTNADGEHHSTVRRLLRHLKEDVKNLTFDL